MPPDILSADFQFSNSKVDLFYGKCLAHGHLARRCIGLWRCKSCFHYGHKARWCLTKAHPKIFWAPKASATQSVPELDSAHSSPNSGAAVSKNPQLPSNPPPSPNNSATPSTITPPPPPPPPSPLSPTSTTQLRTWQTFLVTPCCMPLLVYMLSTIGSALLALVSLMVESRLADMSNTLSWCSSWCPSQRRSMA